MANINSTFSVTDNATPIMDKIAKSAEKMAQGMSNARKLTSAAGETAMHGAGVIHAGVNKIASGALDSMDNLVDLIEADGKSMWDSIKIGANAALPGVKKGFENLKNVGSSFSAIKTGFQSVMSGIVQSGLSTADRINNIKFGASTMFVGMRNGFSNFASFMKNTASGIWNGLKLGSFSATTSMNANFASMLQSGNGLSKMTLGLKQGLAGMGEVGKAALYGLKAGTQVAKIALGAIGTAIQGIVTAIKLLPNSMNNFLESIASVGNAVEGIYSKLQALFSFGDEQRGKEYRISMLSDLSLDDKGIRKQLTDAALDSFSDLGTISDLTSGIMMSGATKGNASKAIDTSEIIMKAGAATGANSEEMDRALLQLKQSLSSGVLQGDELRSIKEQAPGVMMALSSGLNNLAKQGKLSSEFANVTIGDLKQLGAEGKLTSQVVIDAFGAAGKDVDDMFENMPVTFGRVVQTIKTLFQSIWTRVTDPNTVLGQMLRKALSTATAISQAFQNAGGAIDAFMQGVNEGMAPVYAAFMFVDNAINSMISKAGAGGDALNRLQTIGQVVGAIISAAIGLIIGKLIIMTIQSIAAAWPIWLIVGAFIGLAAVISYATNGSVSFAGILTAVGQIGVAVIMSLVIAFYAVVGSVIIAGQAIIGSLMLAWNVIVAVAKAIVTTFQSVGSILVDVFASAGDGIIAGFFGALDLMASGLSSFVNAAGNQLADLLTPLQSIAKNAGLSFNVSGLRNIGSNWGGGLHSTAIKYGSSASNKLSDVTTQVSKMGKAWANVGTAASQSASDMASDISGTAGWMSKKISNTTKWGTGKMANMGNSVNSLLGKIDGFSSKDHSNQLSKYDNMFGNMQNAANQTAGNTGKTAGNTGKTAKNTGNKEVDLSDQDIEYLKSIAARDFLININQVSPQVNAKFGDVHETADVNGILSVIEDMVDEEVATSLVLG